jgi:hypothetical protein
MRFIGSPPALTGVDDSHTIWIKFWGAGQGRRAVACIPAEPTEQATGDIWHGDSTPAVEDREVLRDGADLRGA